MAEASSVKQKKSGLLSLKQGEVLFQESAPASSLYIIQTGQIRLYRPKGKGFVDIAILRSGEVIGEMAYFDAKNRRRSCSAAAIVKTEIVEISFVAFEKTMAGLNPWFKTIINTLADRLRQTNEKVKSLESNSVGFGAGGRVADYVFFHNVDIIKILSTMYFAFKAHGEKADNGMYKLHLSKLRFYMFDVYAIPEIKFEEFFNILQEDHFVKLTKDKDGLLKVIELKNPDELRSIVVFLNTQRQVDDSKKLNISNKCERFLSRIIEQININSGDKPKEVADISSILEDFKTRQIPIEKEDLQDAIDANLAEEILVGSANKLTSVVNIEKLRKIFPAIRMNNSISRVNREKAGNGKAY
jgi:CRP/FNR family cyclic AMP-dependent transcriptional regulator